MKIDNPFQPGRRAFATSGFTLVELLVCMVIIAVLSAAGLAGFNMAKQKSLSIASAKNLSQCVVAIQTYAAEEHHYPEGEDQDGSSGGGSWAWQVRENIGGDTSIDMWPSQVVLNPRHGSVEKLGIYQRPEDERKKLVHYAVSLVVCPEISGQDQGNTGGNRVNLAVRQTDVANPATTILLGDAPLKQPEDPASGCSPYWPSLRAADMEGDPDKPVDENVIKKDVDFWLGDKAQFAFVDGSIRTLKPEEVLRRFFQLDPDHLQDAPTK